MQYWKRLHISYSFMLFCAWTAVIAVSLIVDINAHRQEIITIARNVARAYIDKDIFYRNWMNASVVGSA